MPFKIVRGDQSQIPAEAMPVRRFEQDSVSGHQSVEADLELFYNKALQSAVEAGRQTVAFALPDVPANVMTAEDAMEIALASFTAVLEEHDPEIILFVEDSYKGKISGSLFENVEDYLSDDIKRESDMSVLPAGIGGGIFSDRMPLEDVSSSISECLADEERASSKPKGKKLHLPLFRNSISAAESKMAPHEASCTYMLPAQGNASNKDLEERLREITKTDKSFSQHLQQLINKKGLKNSEVYSCANISKQYFSKLIGGQVKPSKEKVMSLAVGLRLNLDETMDFLKMAGYAFSPISQTDTVVAYFIEHQDYSVLKIDIVLFDYGLEPLSGAG